ncbi:Nek-like kinase protein [Giardia lamblia P15]|uniref:Nek-like kinase protein n=1 Tax=Giardia intestinalis (strain P15) TaxID=658858 RepID=E1F485_GIAIA|nr:Nek-like kinase protein [Giardia lamblia P15]
MLPVIDRFRADHELFRGNDVVSYAGIDGVTRKPVRITRYIVSSGSSTQILKQVRSIRSRFTTHIHAVHHEPKKRIFSVVESAPCCTVQLLIDLLYANPSDKVVLHEELIWEIAAASVTALAYLADQGLTHMGISPEAIHLTELGPRLACPRLSRTSLPEDVQSMDIQTLQFTAPEVIVGRGYIPQSDLWSLGATLYTCCIGRPPAILQTVRSQKALETAYFDVAHELASYVSSELASLVISLLAPLAGVRPKLSQVCKHPRIQAVVERITAHASFTDQYLATFSNLKIAKILRSTHELYSYNLDQFSNHLCFTELMRSALFPCTIQLQGHTEDTEKLCDPPFVGLSFDTSLLGKRNVLGKTALLLSTETHNLPLVRVLLQYESALLDYRGASVLATALSENWEAGIASVDAHLVDTSLAHLESGYTQREDSTTSSSNIERDNRYTPLMLAVLRNDIEAVWRYSDKFEGMRDASERTALFHAVENGFLAIARFLATREVGLTSDFGNTALRLCAERNMPATAALCYKEAGILYSVDQDHSTAIDIALANQNYVVASVLVKHDASLSPLDLFQAIEQHDISNAFRGLLDYVISDNPLGPLVDLLREKDLTSLLEIVAVYTV